MTDRPVLNTDRELYREHTELTDTVGSYYENSLHVTKEGNIGISVGGRVIVMPLERWLLAARTLFSWEDVNKKVAEFLEKEKND